MGLVGHLEVDRGGWQPGWCLLCMCVALRSQCLDCRLGRKAGGLRIHGGPRSPLLKISRKKNWWSQIYSIFSGNFSFREKKNVFFTAGCKGEMPLKDLAEFRKSPKIHFWTIVYRSVLFCTDFDPFGTDFGQFWAILGHFRRFWADFELILTKFGVFWIDFEGF